MESIGKTAAWLRTACVLVDDDDFPFGDDVIDIFFHEQMGAEHLAQVVGALFSFRRNLLREERLFSAFFLASSRAVVVVDLSIFMTEIEHHEIFGVTHRFLPHPA